MRYVAEEDSVYFTLNHNATGYCKVLGVKPEQDSCAIRVSCSGEPVKFCHKLAQHCPADAANHSLQPISQQSVIFENNQGFAVRSAFPDVL